MNYVLQILLVLVLMGTGAVARRRGLVTGAGTTEMTRLLVGVFYPCLIFATLTGQSARALLAFWYMPLMMMVVALCGLVLGHLALRFLRPTPESTARAFLFNSMMNNYLFLPLPLVLLLYGNDGAALLFLATVGFEVMLWTLGVYLFLPGASTRERIRNLFSPPVVVLFVSLAFIAARDLTGLGPWLAGAAPGWLRRAGELTVFGADTLGRATVGVSMVVAGSRIAVLHPHTMRDRRVWLVSAIRLVAVPLVMLGLLSLLRLDPLARGVIIVVSVMPSAIASVIFSERFGGDGEFIAGTLVLTHLWALVTVPLFLYLAL